MSRVQSLDEYWSQLYDRGRDFRFVTSEELSKILSYADSDVAKICLDIGCGTGQLTRELYHRGYACVGVDAATSAVTIAQSITTASQARLYYTCFDIERDNIRELPRQPYSLITCKLTYAFIVHKSKFLSAVKRMLAPMGLFVVVTPHIRDVAPGRNGIAVNDTELELLSDHFRQLALYKDRERVEPLTYFIGR